MESTIATLKRLKLKLANLRKAEERAQRFLSALAYRGAETLVDIEIEKIKDAELE